MKRRHALFLLFIVALIAASSAHDWLSVHPYVFRDPPSAAEAFTWDLSAQIDRRGSCAPGGGLLDQGWQPKPGRYVLSLLVMEGPRKWRTIRGRLWLHAIDSASRSDPRLATSDPGDGDPILHGATDLALSSLFDPGAFHSDVRPAATSTDPRAPGVLVIRHSASRIVMRIGSGSIPRSGEAPMSAAGFELTLDQGVGDGFSGSWRGGDSTLRSGGFFCVGWIDV